MIGYNSMSAMYLKSAFFLPINEHIKHLGFQGKYLTSLCFILAALFAITHLRTQQVQQSVIYCVSYLQDSQ